MMNVLDNLTTSRFILSLCLLLSVHHTFGSLIIDPLRTERFGAPGETIQGTITVENAREYPIVLETRFEDYSLHRASLTNWIQFNTDARPLEPGEATSFDYTVEIPTNATGEFYGRISFSEAKEQSAAKMVGIRTAISVPLYVVISGTEIYEAEITDIKIKTLNPLFVQVIINHTGNAHLRALGRAVIRQSSTGEEVCQFQINTHNVPVYPGRTDNELTGKIDNLLPPGDYIVEISIPFPDQQHALTSSKEFTIKADNSTHTTDQSSNEGSENPAR